MGERRQSYDMQLQPIDTGGETKGEEENLQCIMGSLPAVLAAGSFTDNEPALWQLSALLG